MSIGMSSGIDLSALELQYTRFRNPSHRHATGHLADFELIDALALEAMIRK